MKYRSTRGSGKIEDVIDFESAVLNGLAPEGGLYIPTDIPQLDEVALDKLRKISGDFSLLAVEILSLYIDESEISREELKDLVNRSYSTFQHPDVTPVIQLPAVKSDTEDSSNPLYLLELFHGPTFAFKDVALQFLGNLFEFFPQAEKMLSWRQMNQGIASRLLVLRLVILEVLLFMASVTRRTLKSLFFTQKERYLLYKKPK
ncbi:threonine synthase [Entomophthora muscae]|uniref:Threonine synthase n=1 Tax=Entomophthora muscae TaxID=34485 RepID=A0ACC2TUQ1_9FUNG|nr:threonine synthase [Entomophthora muscae]